MITVEEHAPIKTEQIPDDGIYWLDPEPLIAKHQAEPYPFHALPDVIRSAVEEVRGFVKAPAALVASSAISAISLACQSLVDVKRAEGLQSPSSLFMLTIADSGERKTSADKFFTAPITAWQIEKEKELALEVERYKTEISAWTAQREAIVADIKAATRDKKGSSTGAKKNVSELKDDLLQLEHEMPIEPLIPKLLLGDETPENLAWTLAKKYPSAGVLSNEAGVVFGSHGMGKDSAMRNLALLNTLWDGGELSIGRRTSESFTVRDTRFTMALMVQEQTLREFFTKSGALARGTGFLARFLVAWPESTQGYRLFTDPPDHWPHLNVYQRRITEVLNLPVPMTEAGTLAPTVLELTPEAKQCWVEFHDAIEVELSRNGELYDVRDVAAKTADNAARLAALFQMFEQGIGAISADNFERAEQIATWHLSESRRFFSELALPDDLQDAAKLDWWLFEECGRHKTGKIGKNHVLQHSPIRKKERLDNAIKYLNELNRVQVLNEGKKAMIHLHPALWRC